jgi:hypothetical protein
MVDAARIHSRSLRIVCPFIKERALERLLAYCSEDIRVITRFNLADFAKGVSDISAIRRLLRLGASVRGVKGLHSKLYLFGSRRALVTSANLTNAALDANHEFGISTEDRTSVAACESYFNRLWRTGRKDLLLERLDEWERVVTRARAQGGSARGGGGLPDYGEADPQQPATIEIPIEVADAPQAFVKFLGEGDNRAALEMETIDEIERAGCHWALAYPKSKRPTGVKDNAIMFIGRLTMEPSDIRIFGRAVGIRHDARRDNATQGDIARRPWKVKWPRYIRVHDAEFVAGNMENGVSLNVLKETLGSNAFVSTQRNAAQGSGNVDPHKAYRQQAAVELTREARVWLGERLEEAFAAHGTVPKDALAKLDWPIVPSAAD